MSQSPDNQFLVVPWISESFSKYGDGSSSLAPPCLMVLSGLMKFLMKISLQDFISFQALSRRCIQQHYILRRFSMNFILNDFVLSSRQNLPPRCGIAENCHPAHTNPLLLVEILTSIHPTTTLSGSITSLSSIALVRWRAVGFHKSQFERFRP